MRPTMDPYDCPGLQASSAHIPTALRDCDGTSSVVEDFKDTLRLYPLVIGLLAVAATYEAVEIIYIVPLFL